LKENTMMRSLGLFVIMLAISGCRAAPAATPAPAAPDFRPDASVKDIMDAMVDPSADALWESVATISTNKGIEERQPRTDDEWKEVRRRGITLMEATNLLLMNRHVGNPGDTSPSAAELPPDQIEARINRDRMAWVTMVHGLHDAVQPALKAIEARNPQGLLEAGEAIDTACENCHTKYWYPNDKPAPAAP
jgi:hypothetical protein